MEVRGEGLLRIWAQLCSRTALKTHDRCICCFLPPAVQAADSGVAATTPTPAADSGSNSTQAFDFGWVPSEVVRALLEEVGNFRARAGAIELLHTAVLDAARDPAAVLPTLAAFLDFLMRLVLDANFKIAISAMTILEDLVGLLGADAQPHLRTLTAPLTERLGDNVQARAA